MSNATQLFGAINGVYIAGALIGSILSSYATDSLGRRKSLSLASVLATLGGILQAGSVNISMFIAARLIAGFGIGIYFVNTMQHTLSLTFNRSALRASATFPE